MSHDTDPGPLPATLDELIGLTPSPERARAARRQPPEPDPTAGGLLGGPSTASPEPHGPGEPDPGRPTRDRPAPPPYPEQSRSQAYPDRTHPDPRSQAYPDPRSQAYPDPRPPQADPDPRPDQPYPARPDPRPYPDPPTTARQPSGQPADQSTGYRSPYPPQQPPQSQQPGDHPAQGYGADPFGPDSSTPEAFPSTRYALHPDLAGQARHSGQHRPTMTGPGAMAPVTAPAGIRRPDQASRRAHHGRAAPAGPVPADPRAWAITLAGLVVGLGLWQYALHSWDLDAAGPRGIISTIPPVFVLSVLVLAGLAAVELARKAISAWRMSLIMIVLVLMMFGLPNLVDNTGSPPTEYLHVGFIGYIAAHGEVLHHSDARFSWPAFFTASAYLQHIGGLPNVRVVMTWASIVYELLYLAPMILLTRRFIASERARWVAVLVFYGGLWFEQDYFSPQATAYLFMLTILAVIFWVSPDRQGRGRFWAPAEQAGAAVSPKTLYAVEILLAVVTLAMVVGHQLTPLFMIILLVILTVLRATRYRTFWLVTALIFVAWFSYGARDYWSSNLNSILGNVGQVSKSVNKGLTSHVSGNPAYEQMQFLRIVWSAAFAVSALGGLALMFWRRSANTLTVGALAFSPFLLVAVQSYGGEVILRCFLYAMPFLAILVGTLAEPILEAARPPLRIAIVAPLTAVLALGLVVVRGANIPFERVRPLEMQMAAQLVHQVPHNAVIGVVEPFTPLQYVGVSEMKVPDLSTADPNCATDLAVCVTKTPNVQYLFLTKAQEARDQDRENLPSGWLLDAGVKQIVAGKQFTVIERNKDAVVLKRVPGGDVPDGTDVTTGQG